MTAVALQSLENVERHLDALAAALLQEDGAVLETAAGGLRDALGAFASTLPSVPKPVLDDVRFQRRLQRANQLLSDYRQSLARRSAGIDRAVASLLPPQDLSTYGRAPGMVGKRFGSRFS